MGVIMPTKPRDTVVYELRNRNEIVYIGTTNDTEKRGKRAHSIWQKNYINEHNFYKNDL